MLEFWEGDVVGSGGVFWLESPPPHAEITAIETADVALMDDNLEKIPVFVRLSRATAAILTQNIALALSIKAVFLILTFTGQATMWIAVFADMGASLLVVFNGLRLLRR